MQWKLADGGNDHWYEPVSAPGINWFDATGAANARGGYLATILSQEENDFVFTLVDAPEFWVRGPSEVLAGPWLGGFQPAGSVEPGGGWTWLNNDGGFGIEDDGAYTNWHPPINGGTQQPDNYRGFPENALQFFSVNYSASPARSPFWNDGIDFNSQSGGYVVELEVTPNVETLTLEGIVRDFLSGHPNMDIPLDFDVFSVERGIVEAELGDDRTPVFNSANAPFVRVTNANDFHQWYHDTPDVNLASTHSIEFERNAAFYSFEGHPFQPIDGRLLGNQGNDHNDHFTFEVHATFEYRGDEFLDVISDDDLWIFIDDELVLDMGGVHDLLLGGGSLRGLGLTLGETYSIDLFYAERKWGGSLVIDTNMELHTLLAGDANVDGKVDFDDFLVLADKFSKPGGWADGDFDRSGAVMFPDFLLLATNFGRSAMAVAAVPEPSFSILMLGTVFGWGRRRRTASETRGR